MQAVEGRQQWIANLGRNLCPINFLFEKKILWFSICFDLDAVPLKFYISQKWVLLHTTLALFLFLPRLCFGELG